MFEAATAYTRVNPRIESEADILYNAETEAAMNEARDIIEGKVKPESYQSAADMLAALDESRP